MKPQMIIKRLYRKFFCRTPETNAEWYKKNTDIIIGRNCRIFHDVGLGSEPYLITIGDNVEITGGVRIITHDGGIKVPMNLGFCKEADLFGEVVIGDNVFIGINSIILPGVHIGNNSIVGAGSIVTKDVEEMSVVCGVPARKVSTVSDYFNKNKDKILLTRNLSREKKKKIVMEHFKLIKRDIL